MLDEGIMLSGFSSESTQHYLRGHMATGTLSTNEHVQRKSPSLGIIGVAIVIGVLLVIVVGAIAVFVVPDFKVRQALRLYDGVQLVSEAEGYYGAGTKQRSLYYWTTAPVDAVKAYYEERFQGLVQENGWYVTAFNVSGSELEIAENPWPSSIHESICNYQQHYECVTIMIRSIKQDATQLPNVLSSPTFRDIVPPASASLPSPGTLIVYNYWANDF